MDIINLKNGNVTENVELKKMFWVFYLTKHPSSPLKLDTWESKLYIVMSNGLTIPVDGSVYRVKLHSASYASWELPTLRSIFSKEISEFNKKPISVIRHKICYSNGQGRDYCWFDEHKKRWLYQLDSRTSQTLKLHLAEPIELDGVEKYLRNHYKNVNLEKMVYFQGKG